MLSGLIDFFFWHICTGNIMESERVDVQNVLNMIKQLLTEGF